MTRAADTLKTMVLTGIGSARGGEPASMNRCTTMISHLPGEATGRRNGDCLHSLRVLPQ